jgi:hypothetical protein
MKQNSSTTINLLRIFSGRGYQKYYISSVTRMLHDRLEWLLEVTRGSGEVD